MTSLSATCAGEGPTVVLVHGFTQSASSMRPLIQRLAPTHRVVAVDLPGHGGSSAISADLDDAARLVADAAGDAPFDVVGYSLGGRVALHVACNGAPGLRRVAVLSASPGIEDPAARRRRLAADTALADELASSGDVDGFLERWLRNPLFATLPPEVADLDGRRANTARGLADSLRRCSVGTQRWLRPELATVEHPVLFVTGARDDAAVAAACATARASTAVGVTVVPGAGHVCHLEQPDVTARLLASFLDAP
jgi:2-succinyl-6-hydroxy-2,4-cyclohexadiene-1-carboxylate synthase